MFLYAFFFCCYVISDKMLINISSQVFNDCIFYIEFFNLPKTFLTSDMRQVSSRSLP